MHALVPETAPHLHRVFMLKNRIGPMLWVMANLQAYRGRPVNVWRIRDRMAFDGVLEEVLTETMLVRLCNPGVPLEAGDKCIFLMQDMIVIGVYESRRVQSFRSRLDRFQDRMDFSVLATFPANVSADNLVPAA